MFNYMFIQKNPLLFKCLYYSGLFLLFSISSDACVPRNMSSSTRGPENVEHGLPVPPAAKVPQAAAWRGSRSATSSLREEVSWSLARSGQWIFTSALKSSQFPFPLQRNFSVFVKFQPENPSQRFSEKLGTECPHNELISLELTEWTEEKRILPADLGAIE